MIDFPTIPTAAIRKWPNGATLLRCVNVKDMDGKTHQATVLMWSDTHQGHALRTASFSIEPGCEGDYLGEWYPTLATASR